MNVAGVWRLPVVFIINNNQWAISTPRAEQSAAVTLAQKAIACGFPGEQVDGNDVVAVASVVGAAIEAARSRAGPRLVECLTYRLADHTTADDASRYRDAAEVARHEPQEPLRRLANFLSGQSRMTEALRAEWQAGCESEVDAAAETYLATAAQPPETMFDSLYAVRPAEIERQRDALLHELTARADD
jgi:pyruvate dehydrogenase E1 component alpha subunit